MDSLDVMKTERRRGGWNIEDELLKDEEKWREKGRKNTERCIVADSMLCYGYVYVPALYKRAYFSDLK